MNDWWSAGAFIVAGLLVGALAAALARRVLDRPTRRDALRQVARPTAALLFWLFAAAGLIAALASTSPETLDPIPSDLLAWLPRAGVAGLIMIGGYVVAAAAATGTRRITTRATGHPQPIVEATTRVAILAAAAVLALSQLGIDTTILNILVAAVALSVTLALAGIAVVSGRHIARSVAAGRAVADLITPGTRITLSGHTGSVERVTATHVVLTLDNGDTAALPLSATDHGALVIHPGDGEETPRRDPAS